MHEGDLIRFAEALHLVETCDDADKLLELARGFEHELAEHGRDRRGLRYVATEATQAIAWRAASRAVRLNLGVA